MKRILPFLFSVGLAACGGQKTDSAMQLNADSSVVADSVLPKDALSMVEEENKLLEKLIPGLCSRKFPTAEEMKMWNLIVEEEKDRKDLPVLARALVRAYFGNQFWGLDGDYELKGDSSAIIPAFGDFLLAISMAQVILTGMVFGRILYIHHPYLIMRERNMM